MINDTIQFAAIYARYSSNNQSEQSIEGQLHCCLDYAREHNIIIVEQYIDRAQTGLDTNRQAFQQMMQDSKLKKWNTLLVYKLDRFSRNKYEMTINKKILKDNDIKIISVMEEIPDTPEGILLESLLEGMAQYYSMDLSQKIKRGLQESLYNGTFRGGYPPFGYKVINKKVMIDEEEAKIVKLIYEKRKLGLSERNIAVILNELGYKNRTSTFNTPMIDRILHKTCYIGILKKDNEIFDNMFPRIIDNKTWIEVNIITKKMCSYANNNLYLRKIMCGYCREPLYHKECYKAHETIEYLACKNKCENNAKCELPHIRFEYFQNLMTNYLKEILDDKIIETIVENLSSEEQLKISSFIEKLKELDLQTFINFFVNIIYTYKNKMVVYLNSSSISNNDQNSKVFLTKKIIPSKSIYFKKGMAIYHIKPKFSIEFWLILR